MMVFVIRLVAIAITKGPGLTRVHNKSLLNSLSIFGLRGNGMTRCQTGFTLIELMIVIAIMSILATMTMPSYHQYTVKTQIKEVVEFSRHFKQGIENYYQANQTLPEDNRQAGFPSSDKLIAPFITEVAIDQGVIRLHLGNKIHKKLDGKVITIHPLTVSGSPDSPMSWACGNASAPDGMVKNGDNKTDVTDYYLPIECRI